MIAERLSEIVEYKGFTARAFALHIGASSQVFGKYLAGRAPSYEVLSKIVETFGDINAEWLLTGRGTMLKKSEPAEEKNEKNDERLWRMIESQQRTIESQAQTIADLNSKVGNDAQFRAARKTAAGG